MQLGPATVTVAEFNCERATRIHDELARTGINAIQLVTKDTKKVIVYDSRDHGKSDADKDVRFAVVWTGSEPLYDEDLQEDAAGFDFVAFIKRDESTKELEDVLKLHRTQLDDVNVDVHNRIMKLLKERKDPRWFFRVWSDTAQDSLPQANCKIVGVYPVMMC